MAFPQLPLGFSSSPKSSIVCAAILVYLALVQSLRWRRYNAIHKKYAAKFQTRTMTPAEAQEVVHLSYLYDMPLLTEKSTAFALFKTYGIPTISKLLANTRELGSQALVARPTWVTCPITGRTTQPGPPVDDPRANIALARVNWLHAKYKIVSGPTWAEKYGWRPHSPLERYAWFVYWEEIGRRMNIKDIPPTAEEFQAWAKAYEAEHMIPAKSNRDVANYTTGELLFMVPTVMRPFAERIIASLLEDRVRIAMIQPKPPAYCTYLIRATLSLMAYTQRFLLLPRRKPQPGANEMAMPKFDEAQSVPRMFPTRFTSRAWYKPKGIALIDRLLVLIGWHDTVPSPETKWEGYRLEEVGPIRFEQEGHEQVMSMAAKLQGCPISDAWRVNGAKNRGI
ncbi:hypothetical protein C8J57DRAFT_1383454 [Mycena rebaudengoi]|nr:hypothetical protein C8J57DRAFT_1383454 [Mycena rebaudengoi]